MRLPSSMPHGPAQTSGKGPNIKGPTAPFSRLVESTLTSPDLQILKDLISQAKAGAEATGALNEGFHLWFSNISLPLLFLSSFLQYSLVSHAVPVRKRNIASRHCVFWIFLACPRECVDKEEEVEAGRGASVWGRKGRIGCAHCLAQLTPHRIGSQAPGPSSLLTCFLASQCYGKPADKGPGAAEGTMIYTSGSQMGVRGPQGARKGISGVCKVLPGALPEPSHPIHFFFLLNLVGNAKRWLRCVTCTLNFFA